MNDLHEVLYNPLLKQASASNVPPRFDLHANYPNPFNPSTHIKFDLPESGKVSLMIFDVLGRKVKELKNAELAAGYHEVIWNGIRADGQSAGSGIYFVRLIFLDDSGKVKFEKVTKMTLLK